MRTLTRQTDLSDPRIKEALRNWVPDKMAEILHRQDPLGDSPNASFSDGVFKIKRVERPEPRFFNLPDFSNIETSLSFNNELVLLTIQHSEFDGCDCEIKVPNTNSEWLPAFNALFKLIIEEDVHPQIVPSRS